MRIALAGEDRPAQRVAAALSEAGHLAAWFTAQYDQPRVASLAGKAGADLHPDTGLSDGTALKTTYDWLLTVNCARLVPAEVLDAYKGQALNLHNGPLPAYAGRHVTQWGIRNGESRFASTIHYLEPGIDTGDVVVETWYDIGPTETGLSLFDRSFRLGTELMLQVVETLAAGGPLPRRKQDLTLRHLYRHKDALDGRIDWRWSPRQVVDFIRAGNYAPLSSPTYTAHLAHADGSILVLRAEPIDAKGKPGEVLSAESEGLTVACGGGAVRLTQLKRDGKACTAPGLYDPGTILPGRDGV
jgi:methionyl-tRNA formyltransferase